MVEINFASIVIIEDIKVNIVLFAIHAIDIIPYSVENFGCVYLLKFECLILEWDAICIYYRISFLLSVTD